MIEFYHQIALKLEKASLLIWLGLIASSVFCGYVIFFEQSIVKSDQELSAVVLPLWFLSMIALKSYFAEITPKPSKDIGILKRVWGYIKRSFNWFIALVFSGITISVFYLSYKAVMFSI
ncbi:MAG: hypothetical protein VR65_01655 [Desulfobulbaceae bacterium BRH_c16a]|nr:MAG: hypothetical protein VR65_01655 [Desulfobulbaceae bacterium BRH_c16a]